MAGMTVRIAVLALVAVGCGGPDATVPVLGRANLTGEFTATRAVFTSAADPSRQFDVISQDGQLTFAVGRDGRFISSVAVPSRTVLTRTGTVLVERDVLRLQEDGTTVVRPVPFTFNGRELRFTDEGTAFDFTGDGVPERAALSVVLVR